MYTEIQIAQWRRQANLAKLENREILKKYTDKELTKIFNGIGSDGFPRWLRIAISKLHPSLMAVALIHDVEWYERELKTKNDIKIPKNKDYRDFRASNKRFNINSTKMAKYNYGLLDPRRYIVEFRGWRFAKYCNSDLGFKWWKE